MVDQTVNITFKTYMHLRDCEAIARAVINLDAVWNIIEETMPHFVVDTAYKLMREHDEHSAGN